MDFLAIPKFGALNTNGKSFKTTLVEGKLTVNSNVNLADNSDQFNGILMERELVTINSGKTITGMVKDFLWVQILEQLLMLNLDI